MGANRTRVLFYIPSGKKQRSSTNMVVNCWVKQMCFVSRVHWSLQCFLFRSPTFLPRRLMRNRSNRSTGNMNKVKTEKMKLHKSGEKVNKVNLHPRKLTWNLKTNCLKRKIIFQSSIFRFHVSFRGSTPSITPLRLTRLSIAGLQGFTNWLFLAIKPSLGQSTQPGWRKGGCPYWEDHPI